MCPLLQISHISHVRFNLFVMLTSGIQITVPRFRFNNLSHLSSLWQWTSSLQFSEMRCHVFQYIGTKCFWGNCCLYLQDKTTTQCHIPEDCNLQSHCLGNPCAYFSHRRGFLIDVLLYKVQFIFHRQSSLIHSFAMSKLLSFTSTTHHICRNANWIERRWQTIWIYKFITCIMNIYKF
jgi:hypothetical protein